jgi:Glycosyltransferase family 87
MPNPLPQNKDSHSSQSPEGDGTPARFVEQKHTTQERLSGEHTPPWRRMLLLLLCLLIAAALYLLLAGVALSPGTHVVSFLLVWAACFLFYFIVCLWIMRTRPLPGWGELAIIFAGALLFRLMLLPLPPQLSPDVWRYLWDGHIIAHGYSPYLYAPMDKLFLPLRHGWHFYIPYEQFPTKYPPGIELFYLLGYLLTPTRILGLKALLIAFDIVTCGALAVLLARQGRDPRRVIIYAWCPLPIVEFALAGHGEAVTVTFIVLAVLCASSSRRSMRVLAGICIGLATLSKLYPIILLLAIMRKRDWGLLIACMVTIVLGYVPFVLLGHGHIAQVVFSFVGQRQDHIGVIQNVLLITGRTIHMPLKTTRAIIQAIEVIGMGTTVVIVLVQRWRGRMRPETAVFLLTATILVIYAHVFPWYTAALLPWIALLAEPVWTARGINARGVAIAMVWYFTFVVIASYLMGLKQYNTTTNWLIYYGLSFGIMLIGLGIAALASLRSLQPTTSPS